MKIPVLIFIFMSTVLLSQGQTEIPEYANFLREDMDLKECPFDKDADAVIIFDKATSNYNEEWNLITERRIRFKILKQNGVERANIHIPYYSYEDFESIRGLQASIMSFDDEKRSVVKTLDRKSVFDRKLNKYYSEISFTMPNVKVGSIIEYKYESVMKNYMGLSEWYFQDEVPIMLSSYHLYVMPGAEFAYVVNKSKFMPIDIKPSPSDGSIIFEMRNIRSLKSEAFMAAPRDYLQRVNFQFSGMESYYGKKKYTTTWKELTKELLDEKNFGSQITKTLSNTEIIKSLWEKASTPFEKMKIIHDFVKANLRWNNQYSKYADEGVKTAWEKKTGNNAEINFILINLLKTAGLDAYPLLISERDHGKVDTSYSFLDQFNKVVAYVNIEGKRYILDGTDKSTPSFMIPFDLLNTTGFIVEKKKFGFLKITDNDRKKMNSILVSGSIDNSGIMNGQVLVNSYDYSRLVRKEIYNKDKQKYKEEEFLKPYAAIKIDSFEIKGLESDSLPLNHTFKLNYSLDKSGDYYLLNYNLFTGFDKNPFVSEQRFTNIDFGCAYLCVLNGSFNLPQNLVPEALPKNIKLVSPDKSMSVSRQIEKESNTIRVMLKVEFNKTEYFADEYEMVQAFYKKMFDILNEPVVLKTK